MIYLLSNDDGIDAPGIKALEECIDGEIFVFAPSEHQSGCGHKVTTHRKFSVDEKDKNNFSIDGTPADCIRVYHFLKMPKPDWVLSGINYGGNLGVDIYISGTAAAAREASILGMKSIALSQRIKNNRKVKWEITKRLAIKTLKFLQEKELPEKSFWNINLPEISENDPEPEIIFCPPSIDPLEINFEKDGKFLIYNGRYANRKITSGTDVDVCFSGNIAVSLIKV